MPNTLVHLGINGVVTRTVITKADLFLIYIGSVLPDIPWIIQRLVPLIHPSIDLYDLRLYCIVLASLFFCVINSVAIANLFRDSKRVFIILSLGSLIHLLIDSIETKWGNGVHFFAPINWKLTNFGLMWPESIIIYFFTGFGLLYLIVKWRETTSNSLSLMTNLSHKFLFFIICTLIYFVLPFQFMHCAESADNHFIKTLRNNEKRIGKYFEIDRGYFVDSLNYDKLITPFNEEMRIINLNLNTSASMSVRAQFITEWEIKIIEYHIHSNRDLYTYIGLSLLFILFYLLIRNTYRLKKVE